MGPAPLPHPPPSLPLEGEEFRRHQCPFIEILEYPLLQHQFGASISQIILETFLSNAALLRNLTARGRSRISEGGLVVGSGGQPGQQDGRCFFGADGHWRLPNGLSPQGGKR